MSNTEGAGEQNYANGGEEEQVVQVPDVCNRLRRDFDMTYPLEGGPSEHLEWASALFNLSSLSSESQRLEPSAIDRDALATALITKIGEISNADGELRSTCPQYVRSGVPCNAAAVILEGELVELDSIVLTTKFFNECKLKTHLAYDTLQCTYRYICFDDTRRGYETLCADKHTLLNDSWKIAETGGDNKKAYTSFQYCLLSVLDAIREQNLRRLGQTLWKRREVNGRCIPAWQRYKTIKHFIHSHFNAQRDELNWAKFTDKTGMASDLARYLEECVDSRIPELVFDRLAMAFNNGIYMLKNNEFVSIDDNSGATPVCLVYFDQDMPIGEDEEPGSDLMMVPDYMDIQTDDFDDIFDYQLPDDMSEADRTEVRRWIYAFLGRLLYDNGTDDQQKLLFLKGVGGSGKSTVAKIFEDIYPPEAVGSMASNMERGFGLCHYFDKCFVTNTEVREKNDFDTADILKWVSLDRISAAQKYGDPIVGVMKATLLWCGNNQPADMDTNGAGLRRLVTFPMYNKVEQADTQKGKMIKENMGRLIVKVNRAYQHLMLNEYSRVDVWGNHDDGTTIMPAYFHEQRRRMWAEMNPIVAFLEDGPYNVRDVRTHCKFETFSHDFKEWCEAMGIPFKKLDDDSTKHVFNVNKFKMVSWETRDYPVGSTTQMTSKWIVGCSKDDPGSIDPDFLDDIRSLASSPSNKRRRTGDTPPAEAGHGSPDHTHTEEEEGEQEGEEWGEV